MWILVALQTTTLCIFLEKEAAVVSLLSTAIYRLIYLG